MISGCEKIQGTVQSDCNNMNVSNIQRRAFDRVPVNIKVRFYCCETDYLGTITNLSEKGMFIQMNKMLFPFDSRLEIIIPVKNKLMKVPVRVIRMTKSHNFFDGIGVEVLYTSWEYLELVNSLRCDAENTATA